MNIKFLLKQYVKMGVQNLFLPVVYRISCRRQVEKGLVVFADAHHTTLPFSMRCLYEALQKEGRRVEVLCSDYGKDSVKENLFHMIAFMKLYARAEYVVICDNFLPAASCKKRPQTKVIQLWHACGALKKFGRDAKDDVPGFYKGNVLKNCDYVTVSSPWCIPHFASAMGLPRERFAATGVSRTDLYYKEAFRKKARARFAALYPEAAGKKVLLWTPTFRGNASYASVCGEEAIDALAGELGEEWYVIKSLHPHLLPKEAKKPGMTTEELLVLTDLLITDYSSVLFDYLIFERPLVKFAPDLSEYEENRGFYMDYRALPGALVTDDGELADAVRKEIREFDAAKGKETFDLYMSACDGHATERVMKLLGA